MSFIVIIPSRYQSERLPGKALVDIAGKPMLQHVYERALQSAATRVIIATDDERIAESANSFNADVCLTSALHPTGTDRLQEVVSRKYIKDDEIIVNVQGDEPLIPPRVIDQVARNLAETGADMATLYEKITHVDELTDPGVVKVVIDEHGFALYFSRAPVPWSRDRFGPDRWTLPEEMTYRRHVGIYAYSAGFLNQYVAWEPTLVEQTEKLEQLRALSHGAKIHLEEALERIPPGVDTENDLDVVRRLLG